ncbi:AAA family ATPase [Pseudomonas sp. R5(2019)]|uniref:AAA family ATPase n=1 Tax=Pseudomonas sp. R5(2019) TaxID=2697566 RepID=UPI001412C141|nr:AAA family ATPase [Pseudomonas sp. R5(2019)]NBA94304.1 AAA family ATPase [Pseudomonas sp. R5(2019)]
MKILAIRLKNLASLAGPFELDFTAEPLASAGLFAITGPTGAGKSTLLDALCLALYGAVPRLSNTGRDAKVPDADGEIASGDPRTLLRRGAGAGYAEVDFVGIDGRRYRARWEANRARDKAGGKLQNSRQSLRDLDSEQLLASQKGEYKALLEARLGLNFEQFTRAVMLAQSEFSAFLKADDNERSELLEKLTDTALYTRLGKRAFEQARDARDALKQLQEQAGGIAPLPADAREALDLHLTQAREQLLVEQTHLRTLEQQRQWLAEQARLADEQQSAERHVHELSAAFEQQGALRNDLALLEQLAPQRHLFVRSVELQANLDRLAEQLTRHASHHDALNARQLALQSSQRSAHSALHTALQAQSEAAPNLRQAFEAQGSLAHLNQQKHQLDGPRLAAEQAFNEGLANLQALLARQQHSEQQLQHICSALEHSVELAPLANAWTVHRPRLQQVVQLSARQGLGRAELPALEQRASATEQQWQQRRQHLTELFTQAGCGVEELGERLQTLNTHLHTQRQQQRSLEELERLSSRRQEFDQRLQAMHVNLQQLGEQREARTGEGLALKTRQQSAEQALSVTLELLERQRVARSASVEELRGQLQPEQPCPVCGSQEHPWHQPEALLQALGSHDSREEAQARQRVEQLNTRLTELRIEVAGLIDQQKQLKAQEEPLLAQQLALTTQLEAHPSHPQWLEQGETQRADWLRTHLEQLNASVTAAEQQQNRLLALQKEAAQLQQQVQQAQDASQTAAQHLNEQQRSLLADGQRLDEELAAYADLLPETLIERLRKDATAAFMDLDQRLSARLAQLQERDEEQREHTARKQAIELQQQQQQSREQQRATLLQRTAVLDEQLRACQQQLRQLLGEHAQAEHWQQQLEQAAAQARQAESEASQALQAINAELIQSASDGKALAQRQTDDSVALTGLQGAVQQWRSQHPSLDDAQLHALLAYSDAQVLALRQQIQDSEKALEQARIRLQERTAHRQQHQAQNTTQLTNEELASAQHESQSRCSAQEQVCAELRAAQVEDQRRLDAHQHLQVRITEAETLYQRHARLSALIGSAEGDKFRKIAQAYNLDILVHHANAQLRQLVKRYRLKRGGSMLGLLVLDTEMGDELRSVHSLSGGETFLVSLALALGLASMASSTLKIESLFIDEGFGSLDPESLQLAMDALDGLQAQGRKVAVISHVQEMHERIPVQIQVRRQGNGLSTLEVNG